jgi:glycosyltransferase involved in cell wall biosynthesis
MWNPIHYFTKKHSAPRPDVSIVMATKNAAGLVGESIASVLAQSDVSIEIIIQDGNSTDTTAQEIADYASNIHFQSEQDSGVYDALNKGIKRATGRYILILGAGDTLHPAALRTLLNHAPKGKFTLTYGDVFMKDKQLNYGGEWTAERFRNDNLCQQGIIYSRELFTLLGPFKLDYPILADYAFNIQCFGHKKVHCQYVNVTVADYLGDGLSANTEDAAFRRDRPTLLQQNLGLPLKKPKGEIKSIDG